jgi:hypothetical protein
MPDSLLRVVEVANTLLDRGTLTKTEEHVVTALLLKHEQRRLDGRDVTQLREVVARNGDNL